MTNQKGFSFYFYYFVLLAFYFSSSPFSYYFGTVKMVLSLSMFLSFQVSNDCNQPLGKKHERTLNEFHHKHRPATTAVP